MNPIEEGSAPDDGPDDPAALFFKLFSVIILGNSLKDKKYN